MLAFVIIGCGIAVSHACTNLLVSKGASADGSNIISYNADASNFYTTIYHYPAGAHENGTMRKLWSWE
jgi:dipeptidase